MTPSKNLHFRKTPALFFENMYFLVGIFSAIFFLPFFFLVRSSDVHASILIYHEQRATQQYPRVFLLLHDVLVFRSRFACTGIFAFHNVAAFLPITVSKTKNSLEARGKTFLQPQKDIHGGPMLLLTGCTVLCLPRQRCCCCCCCCCCSCCAGLVLQ